MSRRKWPWVVLGLLILGVGFGAGWLIKSWDTPSPGLSAPLTTTETVTIAIPDESEQITPATLDHPAQLGRKSSIAIPDTVFQKIAQMLRPPSPSPISTWGPPVSALLVSLVALSGVLWSSRTNRMSDARNEWFDRFKEMLDLALSKDDDRSQVGSALLGLHVGSTLATAEEKQLASTVLEQIMASALKQAGVAEPAEPGQSDVQFVVEDPPPAPDGGA